MKKSNDNKNKTKKQNKLLHFGSKLNKKILDKICLPFLYITDKKTGQTVKYTNLSSNDLDLLLLLTKYQDNIGVIDGVNYKHFCEELLIPFSSFFQCIKHLEEREYIRAELMCKGFWRITICNNYYFNLKDLKENTYINTNKDFLYTKEFRKLKVNEKKLCLYLLTQPTIKNDINFNVFTGTIKKVLGIKTDFVVKKYLNSIQQFFPNKIRIGKGFEKGADKVTFTSTDATAEGTISEKTQYIQYIVDYFITKFKILCSLQNFKDLITVINQYAYKIPFNRLFAEIKFIIKNKKEVIPEYINTYLKNIKPV